MIANDKVINEPSAMANEFNGFFSKIGKNISDSVKQIDKKNLRTFYPITTKTRQNFHWTTQDLFIFVIL